MMAIIIYHSKSISSGEVAADIVVDHIRWMSVKNAMSTEVISVHPGDRVIDAWLLMMDTAVSSMPVVDDAGAVVGVLSITDINRHIAQRVRNARSLRELTSHSTDSIAEDREEIRELGLAIRAVAESSIGSILPKDQKVHALSPDDSLERAIFMMAENNVNVLPVLKDSKVVGIVTRQDVIWVVSGRAGKHPETS